MMTSFKWVFQGVIVLIAATASSAQQKFPLTPGEWIVTGPGTTLDQPPVALTYCLNDELCGKDSRTQPLLHHYQIRLHVRRSKLTT